MTSISHSSLIAYMQTKPGTVLKYPFDPGLPVMYVGRKMFAILGHTDGIASISLKADPDEAYLQRRQYPNAVFPGYHLNKRHWNTVVLNGGVPDDELLRFVDDSYLLVWKGLTRSEREQIPLNNYS